jgi:predicted nuclease with TOPRIM domain
MDADKLQEENKAMLDYIKVLEKKNKFLTERLEKAGIEYIKLRKQCRSLKGGVKT